MTPEHFDARTKQWLGNPAIAKYRPVVVDEEAIVSAMLGELRAFRAEAEHHTRRDEVRAIWRVGLQELRRQLRFRKS